MREFVDFLEQVVSSCEPHQEVHIILDNLSAHKTSQVEEFLKRTPKLHFTPTYSSRLNQVEIWFARLEREVIARGILTSVQDLAQTHAFHTSLFKDRPPIQMEILRRSTENPPTLTNSRRQATRPRSATKQQKRLTASLLNGNYRHTRSPCPVVKGIQYLSTFGHYPVHRKLVSLQYGEPC